MMSALAGKHRRQDLEENDLVMIPYEFDEDMEAGPSRIWELNTRSLDNHDNWKAGAYQ